MLQPIWAMIKPFGFAVLWIWHPSEVSALNQAFLLPPDLRDWIPEDDLAHFVIEAVERVEMAGLTQHPFSLINSGWNKPAEPLFFRFCR